MDLTRAYFPRAGSAYRRAELTPAEVVTAAGDTGAEPPERFRTFPVSDVSPAAAAARGFTSSALDAAALPVAAIGSALESLGYPNAAANLSGQEAAEAAEWIINRKEPRAIRREQNAARSGEIAPALKAGEFVGDFAGGAALAALSGRAPGLGSVLHASKRGSKRSESDPFPKPGDITINQSGLRAESFEHLRAGGKVYGGPVTLAYHADAKKPHIIDGRHRITLARERGEKTIKGDVVYYGPRLGVKKRLEDVEIPIGAAAEGES